MPKLSPEQYEAYVASVLREMRFWKNAIIYRNKRFPGIRQAGSYEVDIALQLQLTDLVSFLLIIECKNHARPITRPVVQQLAQTRDAVGAQKGAVVSPVGFSGEAVEVAQDLGIALWVMGQGIPTEVVMAYEGLKILFLSQLFYDLRVSYLRALGLQIDTENPDGLSLIDFTAAEDISNFKSAKRAHQVEAPDGVRYGRGVRSGSAFFSYESHRLFDRNCAVNQLISLILSEFHDTLLAEKETQQRVTAWRKRAAKAVKLKGVDLHFIDCAMSDDWRGFYNCFP